MTPFTKGETLAPSVSKSNSQQVKPGTVAVSAGAGTEARRRHLAKIQAAQQAITSQDIEWLVERLWNCKFVNGKSRTTYIKSLWEIVSYPVSCHVINYPNEGVFRARYVWVGADLDFVLCLCWGNQRPDRKLWYQLYRRNSKVIEEKIMERRKAEDEREKRD
jgi:hypothetical protein